MTESIDPAIPLDTNESVEWSGRPRITTILPAVVIGVLLLVSGIVVSVTRETLLFLAVVPLGVAIPVWKYFALQGVQYVITDEALYVKRGRVDPVCHTGKPRNRPEQLLWAGYHGIDLRIRLSYVRNRWWGRPLVPGDRGPSCNPGTRRSSSIERRWSRWGQSTGIRYPWRSVAVAANS